MDAPGPLAWRVPQVKKDSSVNRWFVRWIVVKESAQIIGSTSFHAAPDKDGMVEIGLGIHRNFHNQGYGYEALKGMWSWACKHQEVKTLRYTVSADNAASVALVRKFGFIHVGQQIDDIDGPEEVYELSAQEFKGIS